MGYHEKCPVAGCPESACPPCDLCSVRACSRHLCDCAGKSNSTRDHSNWNHLNCALALREKPGSRIWHLRLLLDRGLPRLTLKKGSGYRETPWLRSLVAQLQLSIGVTPDGQFGPGTESRLKDAQAAYGLPETGIADHGIWKKVEARRRFQCSGQLDLIIQHMPGFFGDLNFIHRLEGHKGHPYWPGGLSGVTLDPGVDFGHADPELVRSAYSGLFTDEQWVILEQCFGETGARAKRVLAHLEKHTAISSIEVTRDQAGTIFPVVAGEYWSGISDRFPVLLDPACPWSVQTVLLSLAYNRGWRNPGLDELAQPLADHDWALVGRSVSCMQQDHGLDGIRRRRRWEGALIRAEMEEKEGDL